MKQAPGFDGRSFDPFSLFQNGFTAPEVDVGRGEVLQALVIAPVVVMIDESIDLLSQVAGQVIFFQQVAVAIGGSMGKFFPQSYFFFFQLGHRLMRRRSMVVVVAFVEGVVVARRCFVAHVEHYLPCYVHFG